MTVDTIDFILGKLDKVKRSGSGWVACCPAHEDRNPSLSITHKSERVLLNCQAGCSVDNVVAALGLRLSDLFDEPLETTKHEKPVVVEEYNYTDEAGELLFQVQRMMPKGFRQRRPDKNGGWIYNLDGVPRVLYQLPKVKETIANGGVVFVVEGERDVHTMADWGLTATTSHGGAGKWNPDYFESLRGARVIVIPDNDEPGRVHAAGVVAGLKGIAAKVISIELPDVQAKGDVTDWVNMGRTKEDLVKLIANRPNRAKSIVDNLNWVEKHTHANNPLPKGIPYPWPKINQMSNGLHPGWLVILAGYTSHGKTAASIELAVESCMIGKKVLFFSLEMPADALAVRVAQRYGLNSFHFYQGECNDWDRRALVKATTEPMLRNLTVIENTRTVEGMAAAVEESQPDLVIVDYLGKMDMGTGDRRIAISNNSLGLSELAKEYRVPVMCLAQLRRNVGQDAAGSIPTEQDLKESSDIEQNADQILFVWRERDTTTKVAIDRGLFILAKSRMGMIGTEGFHWDGARQTFHPVAEEAA